jgi:protein tyrosine phosphatase (PTP) superfamily phosphohydrolase (DUF442 family)
MLQLQCTDHEDAQQEPFNRIAVFIPVFWGIRRNRLAAIMKNLRIAADGNLSSQERHVSSSLPRHRGLIWQRQSCSGRWLLHVLRRTAGVVGAVILAVGLGMAGRVGYLVSSGNVHTVIPGVLYRSGQLSRDGFEHVIARFHIHTVINLRGADPGRVWYENELAAARAVGARHVDLPMSATHMPSRAKLRELHAVLAHAAPPVLIHCQGGADRSGLVAALYELWIADVPPAVASAQLSFSYGHFPWLGSRTVAMDRAWRQLEAGKR